VRPAAREASADASIDRIILPLDGSLLAEAAIPHAKHLAQAFGRPVVLVRTLDLSWFTMGNDAGMSDAAITLELQEDLSAESIEYLEQTAARLRESGLTVITSFTFNRPANEIVSKAHEEPGALIVMSTHGRSGLGRTVLGSVADRVVRTAEAPVLLVRGDLRS
jgi:nucleotide-binding universal stress UspA family protein